jgi:tetratricopeptide (TPR) repeat protein
MRLTFEFGYEDYEDKEHWLPRRDALLQFAKDLETKTLSTMGNEALLDALEQVEELMRFYAAQQDFASLEGIMRLEERMLKTCEGRNIQCAGFWYLKMEFARLNGLLYQSEGEFQEAAQYYSQAASCAMSLKSGMDGEALSQEQHLFLGWSCAETLHETARSYENILKSETAMGYIESLLDVLGDVEIYAKQAPGILDKTADLYSGCGGLLYQRGQMRKGRECFERSIELFQNLGRDQGSDFWCVRAIWVKAMYSLQAFLCEGNPKIMQECEEEASVYLEKNELVPRDFSIVRAAQGLILVQKGAAFQQNGDLPSAVRYSRQGTDLLKEALDVLKEAQMETSGYARQVLSQIMVYIYSPYIGGLDSLGVQLYCNDQPKECVEVLTRALKILGNKQEFQTAESLSLLMRAECMEYMALGCMQLNQADEAIFYSTQSADLAHEAMEETKNPAAAVIEIASSGVAAEIYLSLKEKTKAAEYARRGIEACHVLRQHAPDDPRLALEKNLEKISKKASRKFFW